MKQVLILFILVCVINSMSATNANARKQGREYIDSLKTELKHAKPDTGMVRIYNNISFVYNTINADSGVKYSIAGLAMAIELEWKLGQSKCYNTLALNYMMQSKYDTALYLFRKALVINRQIGSRMDEAYNLGNMGIVYKYRSQWDSVLAVSMQALKIHEELKNDFGRAIMLGNIGLLYINLDDYANAIKYTNDALKINEALDNKRDIAVNLLNLGDAYLNMKDYATAMDYSQKALKITEEIGNKYAQVLTLYNIGKIHEEQGTYAKAIEYQQQGLTIAEEIRSEFLKAGQMGRLGTCHLAMAKDTTKQNTVALHKAIEYLNSSITSFKKLGDKDYLMVFTEAIAEAYFLAKDYNKAYDYEKQYAALVDLNTKETLRFYKTQAAAKPAEMK